LLALLDKAKAFPLLQTYHPTTVANVEHRDLRQQPLISDCGDYEVRLTEAFRFCEDDTLIFQLSVSNRSDKLLEHVPELLEVRVDDPSSRRRSRIWQALVAPMAQRLGMWP
jgi:hypothetical protein